MKKLVISLVLSILLFAVMQGQTRDPFLWPFDEESIWNMPIHDNAVYYDIPVGDFPAHGRYGVDENHTLYLDASYPVESFYGNDGNWSSGRCTNSAGLIDNIHFSNDYVVPDAGGGNTPNNNYAFLLDDNQTTYTGNVLARCQQGGPVYGRSWNESGSVSGDGILGNTGQGASGMSAYGGTIRTEDIEQGEIKHAIKFTVWADEYFYYNSTSSSCYRWPANACDAYASNSGKYRGSNPNLVMGVLFAIDPNLDVSSMNFETSFAPVIFETLQKYGGYAVEDASWDKFYLIGDQGMRDKVMDLYGVELETQGNDTPWKRDMDKIIEALKIVDNNSSTTIGGGANSDHTNRLAPMACPLGTVGSGEMCDGSGGGSGSGEPVPWNEQFSFANGTTSDGGSTSWTSSRGGNFSVQNNEFECSGNGGEGVWESGVIDISSGAVDFSIDIQNTGDLESSGSYLDYLRIYTKVDGGSETLVEEKLGGFNSGNVETVTKADISGNELQIVIRALTTADNEFYNWDNIDVVSASDTDPPSAPSGLSASGNDGSVSLNWNNNGESDLAGYNVYRSTSSGGNYSQINSLLVSSSDYTNNGVTNGTTYYYVVTAEDNSGNESGYSGEASATPSGGGSGSGEPVPWNEQFSFANGTTSDGGSTSWTSNRGGNFSVQSNQFECSGNGGEGVWESGIIDISSGVVDFNIDIQNTGDLESSGSYLDYLRIYTKVDGGSETLVEEKLGGFNSGNVETVTKTDISGNELQIVIRALTTADNEYYNWDNIDVVSATSDTDPPAAPSGLSASGNDGSVSLNWDNNGESDLAGYNVYRSTSAGGNYSQINSSLVSSSDYTDNGVTNDTTYYYVVTAEDNSGNESGYSSEASATPSGGGTSNYYEDFNDNNAQGWIVFDGTWTAQNNQYEQSASQSLSLAYYDGNGFSDYTFTVEAQPHWNNNFGVVFNYQDNNNYYMLDLDTDPKNADLIEMQNGTPSTISSSSYTGGGSWQWYVIEVNNGSGSTTISINGNVEFDNISTNAFSDGKIGLHSKWNPVDFDNVEVNGSLKSARAITETIVLERDLRFDIYPNPVKELLNIELEEAADVKIYNSLGKLVYKGVASRGRNRINTSSYSNGLYLIKVSNDNWGKVRTVIIE